VSNLRTELSQTACTSTCVESISSRFSDTIQWAAKSLDIIDGASANKALTKLVCDRGAELCYFDTFLAADFCFLAGSVYSFGEAWLQVVPEHTNSWRALTSSSHTVLTAGHLFCFCLYFGTGEESRLRIDTRSLEIPDGGETIPDNR
jgi:hypothetical protein